MSGRDPAGVPWYRRAGVWIGMGTAPGALNVGGGLATRLPTMTLALVVALGVALITGLAVLNGRLSRQVRRPLSGRARDTFGNGVAVAIFHLAILLGMMGWVSFYVSLAGASLTDLLGLPAWAGPLALALGLLALFEMGIDRWGILVWLTTLASLALAAYTLTVVGTTPVVPEPGPAGLAGFLWGLGTVVSMAVVFAVRAGDFTWDLASDADVHRSGASMYLPMVVLLGLGAALYRVAGDWNIADVLARQEAAALGHVFLILSVVSPALSGFHSGTLAVEALVGLPRRPAAGLIALVSFAAGALRFDRQLLGFLDVLGALLPPALAVMLLAPLFPGRAEGRPAAAAWLVGAAVGLGLKASGNLSHVFLGAGASAALLLALAALREALEVVEEAGD